MPSAACRMRGGRGIVRAAARPTTATATGSSSGFARWAAGSQPDRRVGGERRRRPRTGSDAGGGQDQQAPARAPAASRRAAPAGRRTTAAVPRRATTAQTTTAAAAASVIEVAPSSKTGRAAAKVSTDAETAHASWRSVVVAPGHGPRQQHQTRPRRASRRRGPRATAPRSVGCSDATVTATSPRCRRPATAPGRGGPGQHDGLRGRRPSRASAVKASTATVGDHLRVLGRRADPDAGAVRARAERRPAGRRGAGPGRTAPARPPGARTPTDDEEPLVARRPQPAGVLGADQVEHDQPQRDDGERLGGDPEVAAGEPLAGERGRDGQPDQDRGPAADAEPRPGDGQEDHGRDEQAGGAEPEQDLGDRGGAEAAAGAGRGGRRVGAGTGSAYERTAGAEAGRLDGDAASGDDARSRGRRRCRSAGTSPGA